MEQESSRVSVAAAARILGTSYAVTYRRALTGELGTVEKVRGALLVERERVELARLEAAGTPAPAGTP